MSTKQEIRLRKRERKRLERLLPEARKAEAMLSGARERGVYTLPPIGNATGLTIVVSGDLFKEIRGSLGDSIDSFSAIEFPKEASVQCISEHTLSGHGKWHLK